MQALLVVVAAGMLLYAGYSLGLAAGLEAAAGRGNLSAPRRPSSAQTLVLVILGLGAFVAALLLQARGGIRLPTPARLDELAGAREEVDERSSRSAPAARR